MQKPIKDLVEKGDTKIMLVVLDGPGGLSRGFSERECTRGEFGIFRTVELVTLPPQMPEG